MKEIKDKTIQINRSNLLDNIRGFTVVLMIIFHFSFDLNYFSLIKINILKDPFWYMFPRIIVFLFFFAVGAALYLAHKNGINWKSFLKRQSLILFWAIIISITTYLMFPDNWIYFGTLHSIFTISFMGLLFLKMPTLGFILGLILFIISIIFDKTIPWFELSIHSWDYISPFPWVGACLFGIFAAHKGLFKVNLPNNKLTYVISYLGKHSLVIYILHQPILFGLILLFLKVKGFLI